MFLTLVKIKKYDYFYSNMYMSIPSQQTYIPREYHACLVCIQADCQCSVGNQTTSLDYEHQSMAETQQEQGECSQAHKLKSTQNLKENE